MPKDCFFRFGSLHNGALKAAPLSPPYVKESGIQSVTEGLFFRKPELIRVYSGEDFSAICFGIIVFIFIQQNGRVLSLPLKIFNHQALQNSRQ